MLCSQQRRERSHRRRRWTAQNKGKCSHEEVPSAQKTGLTETPNDTEKSVSSSVHKEHASVSTKNYFKPVNCNLDRFLDSTCPSVRAHHLPKSCQQENCRKRQQIGNVESLPYFILGDLWDFFDEWSAYGAGVPITLKGHGTVMQYYVPYLSALQLYTRSMKRQNMECRYPLDSRLDCCSVGSSAPSDNISVNMSVPDCDHCLCGVFGGSTGACCGCSKLDKLSKTDDLHCGLEDENCSDGSRSFQDRDWHRHLRFEYFESSPPYARVPVSEKIAQLSASFPELKTLRSVDLLPASWMSIAWYPIYRIPTGPTLQDLEACFLTFHSLSTSLEDGEPSGIVKRSNRPTACAMPLSAEMPWEYPTIYLEAFGLAHYKLRGSIWTSVGNPERRHAASLYRCAESWLELLQVGHPDFNFFRSHNPHSSVT